MATPAAPTAPQPAEAPETAQNIPAPGRLAQLFNPVEPARTHGSVLGSTTSLEQPDSGSETGSTRPGRAPAKGSSAGGEGALTALVRAIAARIGRTGTATTIKRTHTISENRASGNSATSTNKVDRSAKHESGGHSRSNRDAKVHDLNNKASQHHRRTGHDVKKADNSAARSDTSAKTIRDGKDHRGSTSATADTKTAKTDSSSKDTRDSKDHRGASTNTSSTKGQKDTPADRPTGKTVQPDAQAKPSQGGKEKQDAAPANAAGAKPGGAPSDKTPFTEGHKKPDGSKSDNPKSGTTDDEKASDGKAGPELQPGAPDTAAPAEPPRRPLKTRPSREAGYRDGRRTAAATSHVKAWRDGYRDGLDHGNAAYQQEKQHMDTARDRNATRPTTPTMAPASGSTVSLTKTDPPRNAGGEPTTAVPAQVDEIGQNSIRFTADGTQHTMSRREVRNLKGFERRIEDKKPTMHRIAEDAKNAAANAADTATRAQRLADSVKDANGGEALVRAASRIAEHAQALQAAVEEIHKRALRASEALDTVIANANTRHGGIYQAVVDSPLTTPAEAYFYQDKQGD
jgi:hypothetical protein